MAEQEINENQILLKGIECLVFDSKALDFLNNEEDFYSEEDVNGEKNFPDDSTIQT